MTVLAAWRPATSYAKGATVRPNAAQGSVPVAIANGSFNAGDTDWTKDAGWAINTGNTYEGTHKGEYTGTGSGTIKTSGTYAATPGQVITATVKAKVSDAAGGATALLLWYDSSNVLISTSTGLESSVETGVWMQLEVAGVGPDGAAFVTFAVEATRTVGPNVLIDDARWNYSAPIEARRMAYRAVQESAGVSGVVEPAWPTTLGARVNDGTVIWEAVEVSWIEWTARPIIESGLTEPVWPTTVGAFVRDGTANWECVSRRVEDENCPNTKGVCIISSKVFAPDKDIVRFCATAMPLDWSSERDAGYLPTGLQQANGNDMAVLYPYRSNLGCWNANGFQLWQVDPDPTQMALLDQMDGIGSSHPLAACAVGNDLYFLGNAGVRSVGIASAAQNMQAGDVGMPIDVLVQAAVVQAAIDGKKMLSTYWPGMGQYWLVAGDNGATAGAGGALRLICSPTGGRVGDAYSYTYTATGGTAPYTFTVVNGTLPPGLTLDEDTGVLSGTPTTDGSYSFAVQVEDALGVVAYCGWSAEPVDDEIEIEPPLFETTWFAHRYPSPGPQLKFSPDGIDWLQANTAPAPNLSPIAFVSMGTKIVLVATGATRYADLSAPASWAAGPSPGAVSSGTARMIGSRLWVARGSTFGLEYCDDIVSGSFTNVANVAHPVSGANTSNHIVQCGVYLLRASFSGDFMRSSDGGSSWSAAGRIHSINPGSPVLPVLYSVETNGSRLVFGGHWIDGSDARHFVGFSDDYGSTFTISTFPAATPGQPNGIRRILHCGGGVWLAFGYGHYGNNLFRSTDNAASFTAVPLGVGVQFGNYGTYGIDETTGRTIILAITGPDVYNIFQSDDQVTWTDRPYTNGPWPQVYALRTPV